MALTDQQRVILEFLREREDAPTTHEVGEEIRRKLRDSGFGYYDRAYSSLRRLEIRRLVTPVKAGRLTVWEITPAGRAELG